MAFRLIISFFLILLSLRQIYFPVAEETKTNNFKLGNEVLLESKLGELKNKKIALVTNQTGILPDGTHIIDALVTKGINVAKIFTPEHGIRGDENYSNIDEKTGIPIVSIYGANVKPTASDLSDVDVIIYDIQDVGARFYTYTSTLYYVIESAVENNKKLIVCDRPVIINPNYVDGFMLENSFESFVGKIPTPICYGMTCGELAKYLKDEIKFKSDVLGVVKMQNYTHSTDYETLKLKWVKPSPNMFFPSTAVVYPGTCFIEGTNVSEGRGTAIPFMQFGAPWIDSRLLAERLNALDLPAMRFEPANFTPTSSKYKDKECHGVRILITDRDKLEPYFSGIRIVDEICQMYPEQFEWKAAHFDRLCGTSKIRDAIASHSSVDVLQSKWQKELESFLKIRAKYLLYPD